MKTISRLSHQLAPRFLACLVEVLSGYGNTCCKICGTMWMLVYITLAFSFNGMHLGFPREEPLYFGTKLLSTFIECISLALAFALALAYTLVGFSAPLAFALALAFALIPELFWLCSESCLSR